MNHAQPDNRQQEESAGLNGTGHNASQEACHHQLSLTAKFPQTEPSAVTSGNLTSVIIMQSRRPVARVPASSAISRKRKVDCNVVYKLLDEHGSNQTDDRGA
jgi:hypothetical protein